MYFIDYLLCISDMINVVNLPKEHADVVTGSKKSNSAATSYAGDTNCIVLTEEETDIKYDPNSSQCEAIVSIKRRKLTIA